MRQLKCVNVGRKQTYTNQREQIKVNNQVSKLKLNFHKLNLGKIPHLDANPITKLLNEIQAMNISHNFIGYNTGVTHNGLRYYGAQQNGIIMAQRCSVRYYLESYLIEFTQRFDYLKDEMFITMSKYI